MNRTAAEDPDNFRRPVISVFPKLHYSHLQECGQHPSRHALQTIYLVYLTVRIQKSAWLIDHLKLVAKTFSFSGLQKPEGEEQQYLQDDQKQIHRTSDPRASVTKMKTTKDLLMHEQIAKHLWESAVFVHV